MITVWRSSSDQAGAPQRIKIKAIGVDARVVPVSVGPDAVLDPPANYRQVGWWDASARPGASRGQTVVTGHTVHTGGGSMNQIDRLRPGQKVDVVVLASPLGVPPRSRP